jgi:Ca-activated chloride channel family protein
MLWLALLLFAAPQDPQAQDPTPTFRSGVNSVLVDTLALDSEGNPVPDMTIDDFEIYEDDVRQTIATFDVTDWSSYVAARTSTERESARPDDEINPYPRRFVFILNRQGAEFDWLVRAKRDLTTFVVESLADGDEAMVIDVGFSTKLAQQFRANKEETLESIRKLSSMVIPYPMSPDRAAGFLYRDLESLGTDLAAIPGRKVIVLLSNELPTFTGPGSRRFDESYALERAVDSLNQANASVYTIDLRGSAGKSTLAGGLSPLATETGGRYFPYAVSFTIPLRRIGRENQRYYLLSYVPSNSEMDGTYRRIDVRSSRPDVTLIARQGYFATETPTAVTEASETGGATPSADAAPTKALVLPAAVEMTSYFLPTGTGTARVPLSVALPRELLSSSNGETDERRLKVTVSNADESLYTFEKPVTLTDYYLVENVELEPGAYSMQVTVFSGGEQLYQASSGIHVPAGFGERFGLSSIVPVIAPEATGEVGDDIPILPTTTLPRGGDAFLFFQIFPGIERPSRRVHLTYSIFDGDDEVGTGGKDGSMELTQERPGGTPVILRIPMSELRSGAYRIEIRIEDRSLGRSAISEIELRIK